MTTDQIPTADFGTIELVDEGPASLTWSQWAGIIEWLSNYVDGIDGYDEAIEHLNQGYIDARAILAKVEVGE